MKRSLLLFASVGVISLTGCSKDDPIASQQEGTEEPGTNPDEPDKPESPVYFTFTGKDRYPASDIESDTWVVIHDGNGELLEYKKSEPGVAVVFESVEKPVTENITVTLVSKNTFFGENTRSSLQTYMDVEKGTVWTQGPSRDAPEQTGSFKFCAKNVPEWKYFNIQSNGYKAAGGDSEFYYDRNPDLEEGQLRHENVGIREEDDFIFLLTDHLAKSKYMMLPDVKDGDSISVDASQFLNFDRITKIDLPQHNYASFMVTALSTHEGVKQWLRLGPLSFRFENPLETFELGYLDFFKEYHSSIGVTLADFRYSYSKIGELISALDIPSRPAFNIVNDSPTNFGFTVDVAFEYQNTTWFTEEPGTDGGSSKNSTSWSVSSKPNTFEGLVTLPEDFLVESGIYLNDISYNGTTIYTKSVAYNDKINSQFEHSTSQEIVPSETESFSFSPAEEESAKFSESESFNRSNLELPQAHDLFFNR